MTFEKIRQIRTRLEALDAERSELEREQSKKVSDATFPVYPPTKPMICASSPPDAKLALFRQLFAGRVDVLPRRWDDGKTAGLVFSCLRQRVVGGDFRQTTGEMR